MTTNFPDAIDTDWQDPSGSDTLSTSPDGRAHSEHHADLQGVTLDVENQLVGPVFSSASAYTARAATVIDDCEAATGWVGVNTSTPTASTAQFTTGTKSISIGAAQVGWEVNPNMTTATYKTFSSDQDRDNRLHLAFDVRWNSTDFSDDDTLPGLFRVVVADAAALGGNVVTWPLTVPVAESTWVTVKVPITDLTKVRSFGLVSYAVDNDGSAKLNLNIDNVVLAAQTPLELALGTNPDGGVVVPPSYATAQSALALPEGVTMTDLRSDHVRVRGERDVRHFQINLDGVTDVRDEIAAIFTSLEDGDKLTFPSGYRFLLGSGIDVDRLTNVEIDLGGSKFYTQQSVISGSLFRIIDCRYLKIGNGRLYGYSPATITGSSMTTFSGTPTKPGDGTVQLTTKGDAVVISTQNQGYTVDDEIPFAVTIKQSGAATNDVVFEIVDSDAPATVCTATATGNGNGPLEPGTYYYGVAYVDIDGRETTMGPRTSVTLASGDLVTLTNLPIPSQPQYTGRKIFRTTSEDLTDDVRNYGLVIHLPNATDTTFTDNRVSHSKTPAGTEKCTMTLGAAGNVNVGTHSYAFSVVWNNGTESSMGSASASSINVTTSAKHVNVTVPLTALTPPTAGLTVAGRKVYRTLAGGSTNVLKNWYYVGIINDNTTALYDDNSSDATVATHRHPPEGAPAAVDLPSHAEFTTYVTPSASNTVKTFIWKPVQQRDHPHPILRKVSTAVNTITITQCDVTTLAQYDAAAETSAGFTVAGSSKEIDVHDCFVTLMGEDALFVNSAEAEGITCRRIVSYGNRRQGFAMNSGRNITFEDCDIHHPGRSGIDLEPYSGDNFASQITIRRIRIFNPKNNGIASAGNWHKIRALQVDDVYLYGGLAMGAAAQGGRVSNITSWWAGMTISGQNMHLSNSDLQSLTIPLGDKTSEYAWTTSVGGNSVRNVRLLTNAYTDTSGATNIVEGLYLVSGPTTGAGTITDITPP